MAEKFDYEGMKAIAEELIDSFGFTATLNKRVSNNDPVDPVYTDQPHSVIVVDQDIESTFRETQIAGGISAEHQVHKVTMSTAGGVVPEQGDTLVLGSETLTVNEVAPFAPGSVTLFYTLTVE